jgi:hypothetical protein
MKRFSSYSVMVLSPTPLFLKRWIIVNTIMFSIASIIVVYSVGNPADVMEKGLIVPYPGAIVGLIVGVSQEVMLHRYHLGFRGQWSLVTAVGGMIGWCLGLIGMMVIVSLPEPIFPDLIGVWFGLLLIGLCIGGVTGWGQYFMLKRYLPVPWHWVVASSMSRAIGWFITGGLIYLASLIPSLISGNLYLYIAPWSGAVVGFLYGGATARVLNSSRSTTER